MNRWPIGFRNGDKVVYGVCEQRPGDTLLKRATAETFYQMLRSLGAESIYNHADFTIVAIASPGSPNIRYGK